MNAGGTDSFGPPVGVGVAVTVVSVPVGVGVPIITCQVVRPCESTPLLWAESGTSWLSPNGTLLGRNSDTLVAAGAASIGRMEHARSVHISRCQALWTHW